MEATYEDLKGFTGDTALSGLLVDVRRVSQQAESTRLASEGVESVLGKYCLRDPPPIYEIR